MSESKHKRILLSPLNWGLGHASRLIPIIRYLISQNHQVIIGAHGASGSLLKQEFPECEHVELPGFTPKYSKRPSQTQALLLQLGAFLIHKRKEHRLVRKLVSTHKLDAIISDNRYGVYHPNLPSVIITHQLSPKLGKGFSLFQKPVAYFLSRWISCFDQCWIPDEQGVNSISGELSLNSFGLKNVKHIGILSRFQPCPSSVNLSIQNLAIISGPEPQRTRFESSLRKLLEKMPGKSVVVRGIPEEESKEEVTNGNVKIFNHCSSDRLYTLICSAKTIVCRSGYSSIMDLIATGKEAILIPTPGQAEQEYLATCLENHPQFNIGRQSDTSILKSLLEIGQYTQGKIYNTMIFVQTLDVFLADIK